MADTPIAFVSRGAAKASLHHAKNRLRGLGKAETGEFSIASFEEEAARIVVQERCMLLANSDEFREAAIMFSTLVDAYAGTDFQVHARPTDFPDMMEEDGRGHSSAIPTQSLREPTAESTTTQNVRRGPFACLHRYGDSRPPRNSKVPCGQATRRPDVHSGTGRPLHLLAEEVTSMMGKLAAELIKFKGDFLELSSPDFERADEGAKLCNPCFTPLTCWEEQVKAAIIAARQESLGLAKDGKTLLGPVLPRLLAHHGEGAPGGKTGGGGGSGGFRRSTGGKSTAVKRRAHKPCKENVICQNAGARAPAAAAAAAGAATLAAPAVVNP